MMDRIQIRKENAEDDLQIMFRVFDKDETNCVTRSELKNIFQTLDDLNKNEINDIIDYFDIGQNGKISFDGIYLNFLFYNLSLYINDYFIIYF
jgi:Ca2+-binding EF-hand superfamily protein